MKSKNSHFEERGLNKSDVGLSVLSFLVSDILLGIGLGSRRWAQQNCKWSCTVAHIYQLS